VLQDSKAWNGITINAGTGLTGGGDLTTHRTISLGTPSTITGSTGNSVSDTTHTHAIAIASTSGHGIVELATLEEVLAGTDNTRAVTPAGLINTTLVQNTSAISVNANISGYTLFQKGYLGSGQIVRPVLLYGRSTVFSDHGDGVGTYNITFPIALSCIYNVSANVGHSSNSFDIQLSCYNPTNTGFVVYSKEDTPNINPYYIIWSAYGYIFA
jgi:hypothetical protein